ncbi:dihydrodipicolinate synthase family protein [Planctomicrobium sp. SH527]|uniref:dihydrodipicolinate synthase family protein n=1 Tax=Planctomicrobium sp. SH527 TaxID=3448123 RepID=UPI003F5B7BDE
MIMPATDPRRLTGIYTPNLVPLDSRGEINEPELRRYIDWLIDHGVHGLYPNGSTGEFTRFTAEERRRIARIIADQTRGRVPILVGAAEANTRETIAACEYYSDLGMRAVAIVAPYYYKLGPEAVYAYFREIGRNTPIDVTLYNIPMFASPIDVATVQRLSEDCERIIGIKDSSGDIPHMMRMIQAIRPNRPDFSFMTGWDPALMPMLLIGCDGGTNASSGIVPEMTRSLYETTISGRIDVAREIQYDLMDMFDAMIFKSEFPEGFRAAVEFRGFTMGEGRQPMSDKQKSDLSVLRQTLRSKLAERGYIEDRSSIRLSNGHSTPDVTQIVRDVVSELRRRGLVS